jgi:ribosome-binding protein aMBF1 (putative translation factor)
MTKACAEMVMVPEAEYQRLLSLAEVASAAADELPPRPPMDEEGNYPALDYIAISIARDIVRERKALGLSQQQLAELAGVRQETLSRLESGKHSPTVRTVEKIDQALKEVAKRGSRKRGAKSTGKKR